MKMNTLVVMLVPRMQIKINMLMGVLMVVMILVPQM